MDRGRVLITDKVHTLLVEGLKDFGFTVDYDTSVDNEKLKSILKNYQGIVINSKIIMNQALLDNSLALKFIARLGSGMEIIDVPYALSKGISCINSPEGNRNAVAEHAVGMLLALANNLIQADQQVRKKVWNREENRGFELKGKTIGIVGLGNTGSEFAKKLQNWGVRILVHDKYKVDFEPDLSFVQNVSLNDIFSSSDIISLHLPLTKETMYLINNESLSMCNDGVIIINTSRGKVVHLDSLLGALESGKVGGACLDVFENENPLSFSEKESESYAKLYERQNVILSPHIAGWTRESLQEIARVTLEKIKYVFQE